MKMTTNPALHGITATLTLFSIYSFYIFYRDWRVAPDPILIVAGCAGLLTSFFLAFGQQE